MPREYFQRGEGDGSKINKNANPQIFLRTENTEHLPTAAMVERYSQGLAGGQQTAPMRACFSLAAFHSSKK